VYEIECRVITTEYFDKSAAKLISSETSNNAPEEIVQQMDYMNQRCQNQGPKVSEGSNASVYKLCDADSRHYCQLEPEDVIVSNARSDLGDPT
jgi:hypothetical protein